MEINTAPPATPAPAVLSASTPVQIPSAQTAHTLPAAPAHAAKVAPTTRTPVAVPPTAGATATQTTPPAPVTTPPVVDPAQNASADTAMNHDAPTPAPIDTEAETKLTVAIVKLWGDHKDGKTAARRTRAEMKSLRLELGSKLHAMKSILVGTGREGGWAPYLREQKLPVATADRLVGEHQATLAAPKDKLLTEELPEATVDEVRKLAKKMLPKLCLVLATAELVHAFIDEIFWNVEAAEGRETDDGLEVFRTSHEDASTVEAQAAELAIPAPAAP